MHGFESRVPYIRYFFNIASGIKTNELLMQSPKPIFISLIGDPMSGKELVALAFDMAFHPERYPNGEIDRNAKADDMLSPQNAGQVCFHGSHPLVLRSKHSFDRHLMDLAASAPHSKIHIVSNLLRQNGEPAPNYEDDFNSGILDMAITIRKDENMNLLHESGLDAFILDSILNSFKRTAQIDVRPQLPLRKIIDGIRP